MWLDQTSSHSSFLSIFYSSLSLPAPPPVRACVQSKLAQHHTAGWKPSTIRLFCKTVEEDHKSRESQSKKQTSSSPKSALGPLAVYNPLNLLVFWLLVIPPILNFFPPPGAFHCSFCFFISLKVISTSPLLYCLRHVTAILFFKVKEDYTEVTLRIMALKRFFKQRNEYVQNSHNYMWENTLF